MGIDSKLRELLPFTMVLSTLLIILVCCYNAGQNANKEAVKETTILLDSGFYTENQLITVKVPNGATVYYTDTCGLPDNEIGIKYETPIYIEAGAEEQVYVFRFKTYYEDGTESEVITRTYFLGEQINTRYTTNVLHIIGEPEELFGYEEGIFVNGRLFDEFMKANPTVNFGAGVDANFKLRGDEYERKVHVEYFSKTGKTLFSQDAGVRIHGGMSRMKKQKSFRLYARKEYDEQNEFEYPVIGNLISELDGTIAQKHKRLIVRNSGNDNGFGYIRSELIGELAYDAGFPDVMHAEPVCVYINGEYGGIYWIENGFDAQYFENKYGEYAGEFVVLEGADKEKSQDEDATVQSYVEEYNQLYNHFSELDLTIEENYAALNEVLDIANYIEYFAIENYIGNLDWPSNNLKVYRYIGADNNYSETGVFDGRYRHLLYDTDYGFGLLVTYDTQGITADNSTLYRVLDGSSPLFFALMQREDCRNYFINYSCDLMNGAMSLSHVSEVLEEMHSARNAELYHMLEETDLLQESLWNWESEETKRYANVEKNYQRILTFAENRPSTVLHDMIQTFGLSFEDAFTLNITKGSCWSEIQVNSVIVTTESFSGKYVATSTPIQVSPRISENEVFDYWIVNGEIRKEKHLELYAEDIVNAQINIEMVVHTTDTPVIQINAVRAKGTADFIEIINMSEQTISTEGYYLSDSDDLYKYALPVISLQPGETRRFYGKNCADIEGLGEFGMNFNIRREEIISLTYGKEVIETLVVPDLLEDGVYQRDGIDKKFVEKQLSNS